MFTDANIWLKGLTIGLAIAAPVGPIGVLCIRRTLAHGMATGFASGLGAATADAFYGFVAAFGLTFISTLLVSQQAPLRLVGGVFLLFLGFRTLTATPAQGTASPGRVGLAAAYSSTLFLTITNPATILSFALIFAGLGTATSSTGYGEAAWLVVGVFTGSALWWLMLSSGVSLLRSRFNARALRIVNIVSGLVIIAFGLVALLSLLVR